MSNSSKKPRSRKASIKPPKPYRDFPLTPHNSGAWMKKINGRIHYFGKWGHRVDGQLVRIREDGCWQEALQLYQAQKDDLYAGRQPRMKNEEGLTLADLSNRFLTVKWNAVLAGELARRSFAEYKSTTDWLIGQLGKNRCVFDLAPDDFEALRADLGRRYGPVRIGNQVQRTRSIFKYAFEAGLIDKPVRFGPTFRKPSRSVMRRHKAAGGQKLFTREEILALLDAAAIHLRAMVLLGINVAFGNSDVSDLPILAIDFDSGMMVYPRGKTGIERKAWLWPETRQALKGAIESRPAPSDPADAGRVFLTEKGRPWVRVTGKNHVPVNCVSEEFAKVLRRLGINGRRGLGFYSLRHTFRTAADATKDFPAIRLVMGHADDSIDAVYRETIDDSRVRAVCEHVRRWLYSRD